MKTPTPLRRLPYLAVLPLVLGACIGESEFWTLSSNTGLRIKTECKGSSCKTSTCSDSQFKSCVEKAKCRRNELISRTYPVGWLSAAINVCPAFQRASLPATGAPVLADASPSYRISVPVSGLTEGYRIDPSSAREIQLVESTEDVAQCTAIGADAASTEIAIDTEGRSLSLTRPVDELRCEAPAGLLSSD
jgi:hypothetical protein